MIRTSPETTEIARGTDAPVTLVCPETGLPLVECSLEHAEAVIAGGQPLHARLNTHPTPIGPTPRVMVRSDHACAYPVLDGTPVLLGPEVLVPPERVTAIDLTDPRYDEAYREMEHYNSVARDATRAVATSLEARYLAPLFEVGERERRSFPEPRSVWQHCTYDLAAELDALRHLSPVAGKRVLQLGGTALYAIKLLVSGCSEAWIVSPMVGELEFSRKLAEHVGVGDRLHCVAGVGEAIPLGDGSFDALISIGCVHHMRTEKAMPEIARVLAPGGRFSAFEPWRAPLYTLGTKLFGQRESGLFRQRSVRVYCRPMTAERVQPLYDSFARADVIQHGTLTRYPMIALWKLGLKIPDSVSWRVNALDDRVCSLIGGLRGRGSSVALLGTRAAGTG